MKKSEYKKTADKLLKKILVINRRYCVNRNSKSITHQPIQNNKVQLE